MTCKRSNTPAEPCVNLGGLTTRVKEPFALCHHPHAVVIFCTNFWENAPSFGVVDAFAGGMGAAAVCGCAICWRLAVC